MADKTEQTEAREAQKRIEADVWTGLQRIVTAIRVDRALGELKGMAIHFDAFSACGPEIYFETDGGAPEDFDSLELEHLTGLCGDNFAVRVRSGFVRVFCPSWSPDEIPF